MICIYILQQRENICVRGGGDGGGDEEGDSKCRESRDTPHVLYTTHVPTRVVYYIIIILCACFGPRESYRPRNAKNIY